MNYIYGDDRKQTKIEIMEDYVDNDSEVRIIDKIIDVMDIESMGFKVGNNDEVGRPKFNPKDLLKLYVYGYFYGIRSSRKLAKQCLINREVIWLIKGIKPKYRVIADFRKENVEALENIFKKFFNYCIELGLYGKELIVIDGTKVEASASKRKNYSLNKLSKMKEITQNKIEEYMHAIEINDDLDENKNKDFDKEAIESAIKTLEEKLEYYKQLDTQIVLNDETEINFTDPDAKTVKFGANQGTDLGYNVQVAVDAKNKLIAAYDVINNSADQGQLFNMSQKAKEDLDVDSIEVLADKGYFHTEDFIKCAKENIVAYVSKPTYSNGIGNPTYYTDKFKYLKEEDAYICPDGQTLHCITKKINAKKKRYCNYDACSKCRNKSKCTNSSKGRTITRGENENITEAVNERVKENKSKCMLRQTIVEHPFGTLKRTMGFYYLLLRGFKKVRGEISLAIFTYNLKRVINILGVERLLGALLANIYIYFLRKNKKITIVA
ncbi:IS1182 family transposase [Haloimpatiens lingqiaonensis]|uniref:IS1182 family transposase n=1 Tax=Haloimpatiens lingqiaonensis TaxID=1380675 RepID=UPI0037BFBDA8